MKLRLDRYREITARLHWTSLTFLIVGTLGVIFGSLCLWIGVLCIFYTGASFAERFGAGILLAVFFGLLPLVLCGFMIQRALARRKRIRHFQGIATLAQTMAQFTAEDVARSLDIGAGEAHRLVLDAVTRGVLEDSPTTDGVARAPTLAQTPIARPHGSQPPPNLVGTTLHGTYRIEGLVGSGGMGTVYRARHLRTGRVYALKTMLPESRLDPDARGRFEREATAASALGHPNIIGVHDFNETEDGTYYLVMDLLEGETLEQRLSRVGSLTWPEAQKIIVELGEGLVAAHERGLLHRDVKPANVFLARAGAAEHAVLLDFGLVRPIEQAAASRITRTGAALGTPLYMSPEQARGEPVDARSDLYSLAAVLFELVTGAPPFLDLTLANVYAQLLTKDPPAASSVADKPVPPAVDRLLATALAKVPERRFPGVKTFLDAVQSITGHGSGTAAMRPLRRVAK